MTDEELRREFENVKDSLASLPHSDEPLTKEERRLKYVLTQREEVLLRIKEAKEKKDETREFKYSTEYALLTSLGEKHPLLLHIGRIKLRGHIL